MRGCVVAWITATGTNVAGVIGADVYDAADYGLDEGDPVPDLCIDPDEGLLTVMNLHIYVNL